MRLLNTKTFKIVNKFHPIPEYAILTHTWGDDEVLFQDFEEETTEGKEGFLKIAQCCKQADNDGFEWVGTFLNTLNLMATTNKLRGLQTIGCSSLFLPDPPHLVWINTCCINKESSAELEEAINSMYAWYKRASQCYAYLADVPSYPIDARNQSFMASRYFRRGWTLQELLASPSVEFYTKDWEMGSKSSLAKSITRITNIPQAVLSGQSLDLYSAAQKMSWAAGRTTSRGEDIAYCLIGIFNIKMWLSYGEGAGDAFYRLQRKILKKNTSDRSLFTWQLDGGPPTNHSNLALDPAAFSSIDSLHPSETPNPRSRHGYFESADIEPLSWTHLIISNISGRVKLESCDDFDLFQGKTTDNRPQRQPFKDNEWVRPLILSSSDVGITQVLRLAVLDRSGTFAKQFSVVVGTAKSFQPWCKILGENELDPRSNASYRHGLGQCNFATTTLSDGQEVTIETRRRLYRKDYDPPTSIKNVIFDRFVYTLQISIAGCKNESMKQFLSWREMEQCAKELTVGIGSQFNDVILPELADLQISLPHSTPPPSTFRRRGRIKEGKVHGNALQVLHRTIEARKLGDESNKMQEPMNQYIFPWKDEAFFTSKNINREVAKGNIRPTKRLKRVLLFAEKQMDNKSHRAASLEKERNSTVEQVVIIDNNAAKPRWEVLKQRSMKDRPIEVFKRLGMVQKLQAKVAIRREVASLLPLRLQESMARHFWRNALCEAGSNQIELDVFEEDDTDGLHGLLTGQQVSRRMVNGKLVWSR